jgi:ferric enterobactin receptor
LKQATAARTTSTRATQEHQHDNALVKKKNYGKETNRIYRQNFAVTWNGGWDNGITTSNWAQYEHTRNSRLGEGLAGGTEGCSTAINSPTPTWPT